MTTKKATKSKKQKLTEVELATITHLQEERGISRKSAIRVLRKNPELAVANTLAAVGPAPVVAPGPVTVATDKAIARRAVEQAPKPVAPKAEPLTPSQVGANRAAGIALFKLAGRPTKEQFILVYGERGPKMTWEQRAAAGVPAEQFQAALAAKVQG